MMHDESATARGESPSVASASSPPPSSRPRTAAASASEQSIQVLCRFRPTSARESIEDRVAAADPDAPSFVDFPSESSVSLTLEGRRSHYAFDRVFSPAASQRDVYEQVGPATLEAIMQGYNAAVLSYGQTGSGKTYTLLGPGFDGRSLGADASHSIGVGVGVGLDAAQAQSVQGEPGLIPRLMQSLFAAIGSLESDSVRFAVRASYIQIYLENIEDLLNPLIPGGPHPPHHASNKKRSLEIRQDSRNGMVLPEATEVPWHTLDDVYATLRLGEAHRRQACTRANESSSRSHAILLVSVARSEGGATKTSQLYLADLAGSEKVEKTEVSGLNLTEANQINKGLLALGQVVAAHVAQSQLDRAAALAGGTSGKKVHIPYRNSRLTRLLSNAIGGNSRTSLLITCSPSAYNLRETHSTLRFGSAMACIKTRPMVNVELSASELKILFKQSQQENETLKNELASLHLEMRMMKARIERELRATCHCGAAGDKGETMKMEEDEKQQESSSAAEDQMNPTPRVRRQQRAAPRIAVVVSAPSPSAASDPCSASSESSLAPLSAASSSSSSSTCSSSASAASSVPSSAGMPARRAVSSASPRTHHYEDVLTSDDSDDEGVEFLNPASLHSSTAAVATSASSATPSAVLPDPSPAPVTASSFLVRDRNSPGDLRQLLLHFMCPLSKKIMLDPVVALDGHSYDRAAIANFMATHASCPVSPLTGQRLASTMLLPNSNLLNQMRRFYPEAAERARRGKMAPRPMLGLRSSSSTAAGDESAADGGELVPFLSILPWDVLLLVCSALDVRSLVRLGRSSKELAQAQAEPRLWKAAFTQNSNKGGWPALDMAAVQKKAKGSVKLFFKQTFLERDPGAKERERARREAAANKKESKGVYLAAAPVPSMLRGAVTAR